MTKTKELYASFRQKLGKKLKVGKISKRLIISRSTIQVVIMKIGHVDKVKNLSKRDRKQVSNSITP